MISIIIPTLNEEKYLPKLLDCLMRQTYKNYEIIVADAGSKDKTRQIAKTYRCKIVNGGMPGIGRNSGAESSKGDILLFLDADVQVGNNFLKNALNEFDKNKIDIAGWHIYPIGNNIIDRIFLFLFNIWTSGTQLFYPNASGSGIICRRWLHEKVNGFDETIQLSEDMDYARRCGRFGKFKILGDVNSCIAMRRFENEGRLKMGLKLLLSVFYRLFFGEIRSDVFKYNLKYRK